MEKKKMITLSIVTRDEKYLKHLTKSLHGEKGISVLGAINIKDLRSEMKPAQAFLKKMIEQKPDIFILDQIVLREVASLDLARTLGYRKALPDTKTIIVGERYNEENVMVMMQGGAHGFFKSKQDDKHLIKCVRAVARGEYWLDAELTKRVFEEFIKEFKKKKDRLKSLNPMSTAKLETISPREMEILGLISQSMTNEEIAEKLFLSVKTVKTHLRNIYVKAGIRNRVEAALLYTRHALLSNN
jgi:DNA-binding NarL/FixJ family response regulator